MDELEDLRARLAEAEETLRAIRHGEVDALLVTDESGERVFTLRGADAPYRALVEQMQEGAAALTTAGGIIYCNRRFAEFVDLPLEHVIGTPVEDLFEAGDRAAFRTLLTSGAGSLRTRLRSRSRPPIDAHVSVSTVILGDIEHRTLIVTDMSTLTKVQRESRSKDEFLAMLAHELRNPLGALSGAAQVLALVDLREPRAVRARDVIQRQILHMARLVDDLLDVGRVIIGKINLDLQPIDLADNVRTYIAAMAPGQNPAGRIEIEAEPVWVRADVVRLDQIVGNLVANALKFTPPDRPVRVSVSAEGPDAVLRVIDEGSGVGADLLPHIFDLFVQADETLDRSKGGLGIGLTLVRRLVELHGGTVEASSDGRNRGATFTVRLPQVPAAEAPATIAPPGITRIPRRVLLVDDQRDARELYGMVLEAEGHEVQIAEDGPSALALLRHLRPDVAVIDIGLPGMDGYELARRIRAEPEGRHVTLIALTGYSLPEDRERSRAAGFDRHLVKPAAREDLQRELSLTVRVTHPGSA